MAAMTQDQTIDLPVPRGATGDKADEFFATPPDISNLDILATSSDRAHWPVRLGGVVDPRAGRPWYYELFINLDS
jgi:hypothetical protein